MAMGVGLQEMWSAPKVHTTLLIQEYTPLVLKWSTEDRLPMNLYFVEGEFIEILLCIFRFYSKEQ